MNSKYVKQNPYILSEIHPVWLTSHLIEDWSKQIHVYVFLKMENGVKVKINEPDIPTGRMERAQQRCPSENRYRINTNTVGEVCGS